jgi:hypothetical protein
MEWRVGGRRGMCRLFEGSSAVDSGGYDEAIGVSVHES